MEKKKLELLAPARDADTAIAAIEHGADAVYMGPPAFGARKAAPNTLDDIRRVADYAHIFGAKVYSTVNTIIYDRELKAVEKMIRDLWMIGVDALIVQDMGVLRMDIPPISLHASTQCDIRTPEKALFLQESGFSQLVLARELSIGEIKAICDAVTVPVETFVYGALCTGFSGRCQAGYATSGRSGNRGECPQICRLPFTLRDNGGEILVKDKYLLSLKDFNAIDYLKDLIDAGVTSFKIEGRLKETGYVKNIVSAVSRRLNSIIDEREETLERSSYGKVDLKFDPDIRKSFNRGLTTYRLGGVVDPNGISSTDTSKSLGETIKNINDINPGDGISWFNNKGEYEGTIVNGVQDGKIIGNRPFVLPKNVTIHRTSDVKWRKLMASDTAQRKLSLEIILDSKGITGKDEAGTYVRIENTAQGAKANKEPDFTRIFNKLGNTPFTLRNFKNLAPDLFFPASELTELRRKLTDTLIETKKLAYTRDTRRKENIDFPYSEFKLDSSGNVSNKLAESFYRDHGVKEIEPALETGNRKQAKGTVVMQTKHCILRDIGLCLKTSDRKKIKLPLCIENDNLKFRISTDCANCEMQLTLI